jgi:hypothetical protein
MLKFADYHDLKLQGYRIKINCQEIIIIKIFASEVHSQATIKGL